MLENATIIMMRGWEQMIHAYDELYLGKAQMTLAWMFDYAVNGCRLDVEEFYGMFLTSTYAHRKISWN